MLGVASEAAFLEMIYEGRNWLGISDEKFVTLFENRKITYSKKIQETKKVFERRKNDLPEFFSDSYSLCFDSLLDLYRLTRNDAGHPTGKEIHRDDQYTALHMFGRYIQRLYLMKSFFKSQ
jgi:hypothetical protein